MRSPRYTILIANRKTGAVRRLTASRRVLGLVLTAVIATPLVVGMGSRGADEAQVDALRVANETLLQENQSYREATGELTSHISSLQTALTELGEQGQLDPNTKRALDKLPLSIRSQAAGGPALDRRRLELPGHIKTTGSYSVQVKLHPEVTATFPVNVVAAK